METKEVIPLILAGGSGTRLWPLSREYYPKQLLTLTSEKSLLQNTVSRYADQYFAAPWVITNEEYRFLVTEQLKEISVEKATIILEPAAKNTAPAIAIAAFYALRQNKDPVFIVSPADHYIKEESILLEAMKAHAHLADQGYLLTFGITPSRPATEYGYIEVEALNKQNFYPIKQFKEKPSLDQAEAFLAQGNYLWNSGLFLFKASAYLKELKKYAAEMYTICQQVAENISHDLAFLKIDKNLFSQCPANSIDYAVMEKTKQAVVVPINIGWSDIGSWPALHEIQQKDDRGNVIKGNVIHQHTQNCYLQSSNRLVVTLGVENHTVVETPDCILVAANDKMDLLKDLIAQMKIEKRGEVAFSSKVFRPWGNYETLAECMGFKVKKITINPGASLSLQYHDHRSEHWVVVEGSAQVIKGDEEFTLQKNESTYIPIKTQHRLANPTMSPLIIIEVQVGGYLGEDDIVRLADQYGR